MDIFIHVMAVIFICPFMVYVFGFLFPVDPTIYHLFGGWWYLWMDGGNHLCIHFHIVVLLPCIDGWHIILTIIFFIYAFIMHLALLYHILIYVCVKGELHLKSLPRIFVITSYVLSSSKRGRLLAQRPFALSFDDNKPYVVRY